MQINHSWSGVLCKIDAFHIINQTIKLGQLLQHVNNIGSFMSKQSKYINNIIHTIKITDIN